GCNRSLIELPRNLQAMSALELLQRSRTIRTPHSICLARISPVLFQALLYRHDAGLAKRLRISQGWWLRPCMRENRCFRENNSDDQTQPFHATSLFHCIRTRFPVSSCRAWDADPRHNASFYDLNPYT